MKNLSLKLGIVMTMLASGNAIAANPRAVLDIYEANATTATWSEDVSALLTANANGNFSLISGNATNAYFQSGVGLSSSAPSTTTPGSHPDYWTWTTDAANKTSYWSWQSLDGSATAELHNAWGLGSQKVDLEFTVKNNSANTRTYTFSEGEDFTAISSPTVINAQFNATALSSTVSNTLTPISGHALQELYLYNNPNGSAINANANLGSSITLNGTTPYSATVNNLAGPAGSWNYMELVSKFTLSGNSDKISVNGWATITPVPEADTYAMMLAGLAMIGVVARRRNI